MSEQVPEGGSWAEPLIASNSQLVDEKQQHEMDYQAPDDASSLSEDEENDSKEPREKGTAELTESEEELEEEDLELLQENLRHSAGSGFLRLRQRGQDSDEAMEEGPDNTGRTGMLNSDMMDEEEEDEEGEMLRQRKRVAPEELERLFEDEDEDEDETKADKSSLLEKAASKYNIRQERALLYEESDEEDGLDDFIEDDEPGAGDRSPKTSKPRRAGNVTKAYLEEAFGGRLPGRVLKDILDIFGDGTDYLGLVKDEGDEVVSEDSADEEYTAKHGSGDESTQLSAQQLGKQMKKTALAEKSKNQTSEKSWVAACDIPERIQQRDNGEARPPAEVGEIETEAAWIVTDWMSDPQLMQKYSTVDSTILCNVVAGILRLFRESLLEVPTVATHRKEYFQHLMGLTELWAIWDADERWKLLRRQQGAVLQQIEQASPFEDEEKVLLAQIVRAADSLEVLEVIGEYIRWYRRQCSSPTAGLFNKMQTIIKESTLSMPRFVENMQKQRFDHHPPTPTTGIVELSAQMETGEGVVTPPALTLHLAAVIGHHPWGQLSIRANLERIAAVTVAPTARGYTEIDVQHELAPIKFVKEKPVAAFQEDQFLLLVKGQQMGLLRYEVVFPGMNEVVDHLIGLFGGSQAPTDDAPCEWAEVRRNGLLKAVEEYILPRLKRDVLAKLQDSSERWVATAGQYTLQEKLMVMPYDPIKCNHPIASTGRSNLGGFRVMGVSWGRGGPDATTMVAVVDERGRIVEQLKIPRLNGRHRGHSDHDAAEQAGWWDVLKQAIVEHEPSCIVVAGRSLDTRDLYDEVRGLTKTISATATASSKARRGAKYHQQHPTEVPPIPVMYGDDDTARIFMDSPRGLKELPASEVPALMRYSVSLARRWINPLLELAAISDPELLGLDSNPMASLVDKEMRLKYLHRAFVNVVNLVGVDINSAVETLWMRSPLKYVCGLGPVKAEALIKAIAAQGTGRLANRSELLHKGIVGPLVFANCASFLRIPHPTTTKGRKASGDATDPLDCTRIHPENYSLAIKIATDATMDSIPEEAEANDDEQEGVNSDAAKRAIRLAMSEPEKLNDLLLDEYAKELIKRGQPAKHLTLLDIKSELQNPYADLRSPSKSPSDETLFQMLTGETERTLWVGSIVRAVVHKLGDRTLYCKLESGITGVLPLRRHHGDPSDGGRLRVGQTVMARIRSIDPVRMEVELAGPVRPDEPMDARFGTDPYYDFEAAKQPPSSRLPDLPMRIALATDRVCPLHKSITTHPAFRDSSRGEAEEFLRNASLGEVVFRPSSTPDQFNLTWKVSDENFGNSPLYQHIPIRRKSNGHYLLLEDNLEYEELDEILARHVESLAGYIRDVRTTPKYFAPPEGSSDARKAVEDHLETCRRQEPSRIAYALSLSQEQPGHLLLSYLPSSRVYHELIHVTPTGYQLRGVVHGRIEELVDWFKVNYRSIPQAATKEPAREERRGGGEHRDDRRVRPSGTDHHRGGNRRDDEYSHRPSRHDHERHRHEHRR